MIDKDDLKGKYVYYMDNNGKFRTEKVVRVSGNYLTVRTIVKIQTVWKFPKRRIHLEQVFGRYLKRGLEEIRWNGKKREKRKYK